MPKKVPLAARILLGFGFGLLIGLLTGRSAGPFQVLGSTILGLIKGLAGPMILFAILDAFLRTEFQGRSARGMVGISLTNGLIALTIGLAISNILMPGLSLRIEPTGKTEARDEVAGGSESQGIESQVAKDRRIDFLGDLLRTIPDSIVRPFLDNSVIGIVILAVFAGLALRG